MSEPGVVASAIMPPLGGHPPQLSQHDERVGVRQLHPQPLRRGLHATVDGCCRRAFEDGHVFHVLGAYERHGVAGAFNRVAVHGHTFASFIRNRYGEDSMQAAQLGTANTNWQKEVLRFMATVLVARFTLMVVRPSTGTSWVLQPT